MSWETKLLGDVAELRLGKMLDEKKNKGQYLPYLANINVRWGSFDLESVREMRFEEHEIERYGLRYGDIVMCEGGEPGRCAIWKDEAPGMMIQKAIHRIRPYDCLDYRFLYYSFLHKGRTGEFSPLFTGATIQHLPRQNLAKVEVEVPPLDTQHRIASILSAYDDLIENNRRRMALLEQAARLLYREWFVHLRFPGHEHVEVVDGVPVGWELGRVIDFYETASGGTPSRKRPEYFKGEINWVKTQELNDGWIFTTEEQITPDAIRNSSAKIFPINTVLIAMYGATIGQTGLLAQPSATNQACCAVLPEETSAYYAYAFLFFLENRDGLRNLSQGAAQNNISQQVIRNYPMLMAPHTTMESFAASVKPLLEQTKILTAMNAQLTEARDLLLPRLMNGEIAV